MLPGSVAKSICSWMCYLQEKGVSQQLQSALDDQPDLTLLTSQETQMR